MEQQHHGNIEIPVPVIVGTIGGIAWTFFVLTYLMIVVMDALRS